MDARREGSLAFGAILFVISLIASFYEKVLWLPNGVGGFYRISQGYPYQTFGYVLAIIGIVFVAKYRRSKEAQIAGELVASRFFKKDKYADRQNVEYWFRFSYPFWFTDLLSALNSLSMIGIEIENPQIKKALLWFVSEQRQNGAWKLRTVRGEDKDIDFWISLAICRIFKRYSNSGSSKARAIF